MRRLLVALILCVLLAGCNIEQPPPATPKFKTGDMVELRLGPIGQVVRTYTNISTTYRVRILTDVGPKTFTLAEFELKDKENN